MRGRLKQTLLIGGLLQLGDTLSYWTFAPDVGPIPGFGTFYGPVLTSAIMRLAGATALVLVLKSSRKTTLGLSTSYP